MAKIRQKYWQFLVSDSGLPVTNTKVKVYQSNPSGEYVYDTIPIYDSIDNLTPIPNSEVTTNGSNGYFQFWVQSDDTTVTGIQSGYELLEVGFNQKIRLEWDLGGTSHGSIDEVFVGTKPTGERGKSGTISILSTSTLGKDVPCTVTNIGTNVDANLMFGISIGHQGVTGSTGTVGADGVRGSTGKTGKTGTSASYSIGHYQPVCQETFLTAGTGTYDYKGPTRQALVTITAGGGGGGGGNPEHNIAGGGGGSGGGTLFCHIWLVTNTLYTYTVGVGGAGGYPPNNDWWNVLQTGQNGSNSVWNGIINNVVGIGGKSGGEWSGNIGGTRDAYINASFYCGNGGKGFHQWDGGTPSSQTNITASLGGAVFYNSGKIPYIWNRGGYHGVIEDVAGGGGASLFGEGGNSSQSTSAPGLPGTLGSGGGGGQGDSSNGASFGGKGGDGCIKLWW